MEEKRELNVSEFVKMFVTVSYLQEQRIFKFTDIWKYVEKCHQHCNTEFYEKTYFPELIDEVEQTIDDMLDNGILSNVYTSGGYGMYRISDKVDYTELAKQDKEYVADMVRIFLDINGGASMIVKLSPTKSNIKK